MFDKLWIFFGILLAFQMVFADDSRPLHAVQYASETFPIEMAKKDHFVMFYTTWCGHSRRIAPTWEQLAARINGIEGGQVRIAKVDCDASRKICIQNSISRYPTMKFFTADTRTGIKYSGSRSLSSLTRFVNEQTASAV